MAARGGALSVGGSWTKYAWVCQGEGCAGNRAQDQYRVHKRYFTTASELNSAGTGYVSNKNKVYCPACSESLQYANVPPEAEFHWQWMSGQELDDLLGEKSTRGGKDTGTWNSGADTDTAISHNLQTLTDRVRKLEQLVPELSKRLRRLEPIGWQRH
jgi:hypothetical protein